MPKPGDHGYTITPVELELKQMIENNKRRFDALIFRCFICNLDFLTKQQSKDHFKQWHKFNTPTNCRLCNLEFVDPSSCLDHMATDHSIDIEFTCEVCGNKFFKHSEFMDHQLDLHRMGPKYRCEYCGKRFKRVSDRNSHVRMQHIKKPKPKPVPVKVEERPASPSVFPFDLFEPELEPDIKPVLEPSGDPLIEEIVHQQCYICGYDDLGLTTMEEHIKNSHSEFAPNFSYTSQMTGPLRKPELQCEDCKYYFRDKHEKHLHLCGKPDPLWLGIPLDSTFKCELCGEEIKKYHPFLWHNAMFHNVEKLKYIKGLPDYMKGQVKHCKKCDFSELCTWKFRRHMRQAHAPLKKCEQCDKWLSESHMKAHMRKTHSGKTFACDICDKQLSTSAGVTHHKIIYHGEGVECDICGKKVLEKHLELHKKRHKTLDHKCPICKHKFSKYSAVERHMIKHQLIFICSLCEEVFTSQAKLINHLTEKHGYEELNKVIYPCPLCRVKHESLKELNEHVHLEHKVAKDQACNKCDRLFCTKAILTMHLMEMHEFDPESDSMTSNISIAAALKIREVKVVEDEISMCRKVKCEECGKFVKSERVLADHIKQMHRKWTHTLFCGECDWSTFEPYRLKKHMREKHDDAQYHCNKCNWSTRSRWVYGNHMKRHDKKLRSYKCPECNEGFLTKHQVKLHMWSEHGLIYKYQTNSKTGK